MSLVLGGLDVVGEEMDGEGPIVLGRHTGGHRGHGKTVVATPPWMNATTSQGVSRPQEEMDFLPFDPLVIPEAATSGVLIARPQRPIRGERLILAATNVTAGTDASLTATINPAIYVGAVQVGAAQGGTPFGAFAATAFGVRLSMPAAGQGTEIKIFVALTTAAPSGGVACSGTIIGRAMR